MAVAESKSDIVFTRRHLSYSGRGFTLVELLVVIAIIGILVALLLPAVQAAREAARRTQCLNQLKQIGLAFQLHADAHGFYPDGGINNWSNRFPPPAVGGRPYIAPSQSWGWGYQILPFIEEQAVWEMEDQDEVMSTPIENYFCPSRRQPQKHVAGEDGNTRAKIDYAGNAGSLDAPGNTNWGQMGNGFGGVVVRSSFDGRYADRENTIVPGRHIVDGMSKTLMVGEKCMNSAFYSAGQEHDDDDAGYVDGWDWDIVRWGYFQPAPDYNDPVRGQQVPFMAAFGSSHPSGFHGALCDGSVRSISYSVDLETFERLSSRNDQEVFSLEEL